jgi:hypothetical protein
MIRNSQEHDEYIRLNEKNNIWLFHSSRGNLESIKELHKKNIDGLCNKVIDVAAMNGHLNVIEWLDRNTNVDCTSWAMDWAALNGHMQVVVWLHFNKKTATHRAFDNAAKNGHLEIVKFLDENRLDGCTTDAFDNAIINGNLEMVEWLYNNKKECCKSDSDFILLAIEHNQWKIVDWYDENVDENLWTRLKRNFFHIPRKTIVHYF